VQLLPYLTLSLPLNKKEVIMIDEGFDFGFGSRLEKELVFDVEVSSTPWCRVSFQSFWWGKSTLANRFITTANTLCDERILAVTEDHTRPH
jgi:hypothetical protein